MFLDRSRYKCIGCNKWINKKDYPHPRDLLFTLNAIRPFLNRKTQEWVHPEKNGYFHLEIKCLQMHDPTIELRQATITDDTFLKLSQQQLQFLAGNGLLEHVVSNKGEKYVRYVRKHFFWLKSMLGAPHMPFAPDIPFAPSIKLTPNILLVPHMAIAPNMLCT